MGGFLELLPSLILIIVCILALLTVSGTRYSKKKTFIIIGIYTLVIAVSNYLIFRSHEIKFFDSWASLTVFLPEFILVYFLGKRKPLSRIVAIINSYVAFYIIVLLRNVIEIYFNYRIFTYILYFFAIPLLFYYLVKFYKGFHDEVESLSPKLLTLLGAYSLFILIEFYVYRYLSNSTAAYVLRLEIFGVAVISVYIISIMFFNFILKQYKETFIKAKEKDNVDRQLQNIVEQYKVKEEKDDELRIVRHDMRHLLITVSSLIQQSKLTQAQQLIDEYIKTIDNTKIIKYCNDPIINSIISYYKSICIRNKINLKIKIKNIETPKNIKSSDIAILISNCFDNAINASMKLSKNRYIEFKFINTDGKLVLQVKNNYKGDIQYDSNELPTNLNENHGIGTQSIASFCKKNKLTLDYDITDSLFTISIIF